MSYTQDRQYSDHNYGCTPVEQYISDAELRASLESRKSIYVIPSIVSPYNWIVPQEEPPKPSASNTILYASALQFEVAPSSSALFTQIVPTMTEPNLRGEIRQDKNERRIAKHRTYTRTEPQFWCDKCKVNIGRRYDMGRHLETSPKHGNKKRFNCGICSRCFAREDSLNVTTFQMYANQTVET